MIRVLTEFLIYQFHCLCSLQLLPLLKILEYGFLVANLSLWSILVKYYAYY